VHIDILHKTEIVERLGKIKMAGYRRYEHYHCYTIVLVSVLLVGIIPASFAQNSTATTTGPPPPRPITVITNKASYTAKETVVISGQVSQVQPSNNSVMLEVIAPQGKKLLSASAPLSENGTYTYNLHASSTLHVTGEHKVIATYGQYNSAALFMFIAHPFNLTIDGKSYSINYTIESGLVTDITANTQEKSLALHLVNSTRSGNLTISLPREVIDSQNNNVDTPFMVFINGQQAQFNETTFSSINSHNNNSFRTLEIHLPFESQANPTGIWDVTITGTTVVPEFGSSSLVILAVCGIVLLTMLRRGKLTFP
jgi:hypothetical protein